MKKILKILAISILTMLIGVSTVNAHGTDTSVDKASPKIDVSAKNTDGTENDRGDRFERIKERRDLKKEKIEQKKDDLKERRGEKKDYIKERRNEKRDDVKEKLQNRKESLGDKRDSRKEGFEKRRENIKENIGERKKEIKEKRAERRQKLGEKRRERIAAFAERMSKRLSAAVNRIEKLGDRVESRIEKFNERGIDTTKASSFLEESRAKTAQARTGIDEARSAIKTALESGTLKEVFGEIRTGVRSTVSDIKAAHKAIIESVRALKASFEASRAETTATEKSTPEPANSSNE